MERKNSEKKLVILVIIAAAVVLVLAGAMIFVFGFGPKKLERKYSAAQKLLSNGRYAEAAEAFEALGDYEDSVKLSVLCSAYEAGETGDFERSTALFKTLEGQYSTDIICRYYEACAYEENALALAEAGDYTMLGETVKKFAATAGIMDSDEKVKKYRKQVNDIVEEYVGKGEFETAYAIILPLKDYDSRADDLAEYIEKQLKAAGMLRE